MDDTILDYEYEGKYTRAYNKKDDEQYRCVEGDGCIRRYRVIRYGHPYRLSGTRLSVTLPADRQSDEPSRLILLRKHPVNLFITDLHIFINYGAVLEVLRRNGAPFKKFEAEKFSFKNGIFCAEHEPWLVLQDATTVFTARAANIIGLDPTGTLYCTTDSAQSADSFLVRETLRGRQVFSVDSEPVWSIGEITVHRGTALIRDIIRTDCMPLQRMQPRGGQCLSTVYCQVVLCREAIVLVCEGLVIRKRVRHGFTHTAVHRYAVHNITDEMGFYELVAVLSQFVPVVLDQAGEVENFLVGLLLQRKCVERFVDVIRKNSIKNDGAEDTSEAGRRSGGGHCNAVGLETVLCRAYRRTDDWGRGVLDRYIDARRLNVDDLSYIIIYRLECIDRFVSLCAEHNRLFYLPPLIRFTMNVGRDEPLRKALLRHGLLLFRFRGLERLTDCERRELSAQQAAAHGR